MILFLGGLTLCGLRVIDPLTEHCCSDGVTVMPSTLGCAFVDFTLEDSRNLEEDLARLLEATGGTDLAVPGEGAEDFEDTAEDNIDDVAEDDDSDEDSEEDEDVDACGDSAYDSETQVCCAGDRIHDRVDGGKCCGSDYLTPDAVTDGIGCCGEDAAYNRHEAYCCAGVVRMWTEGEHCCGDEWNACLDVGLCAGKFYDVKSSLCCANQLYKKNPGLKCCAGKIYSDGQGACHRGRVVSKSLMCGKKLMDPMRQVCRGGRIVPKTTPKPATTTAPTTLKHLQRCGQWNFDPSVSFCRDGAVHDIRGKCWNGRNWVGFDARHGVCQNGVIYDSVCGRKYFNKAVGYCHRGVVHDLRRCGRSLFNPTASFCHRGVVKRIGPNARTCGLNNYYDPRLSFCFKNRVIDMDANTRLCNRAPFHPSLALCCGGTLLVERRSQFDACCGRQSFDTRMAVCCGATLHRKSAGAQCCAEALFNPYVSDCVRGRVVQKRRNSYKQPRYNRWYR